MIASIYYVDENHYDISGKDYIDFLNLCSEYSTFFSLISSRDKKKSDFYRITEDLEKYIYSTQKVLEWPGNTILQSKYAKKNGYNEPVDYNIYHCCDESINLLCQANSLFSWYEGRPEDLTFYYKNKKVFMNSISHEGYCILSCTPQVFSRFRRFNYWHIDDQNGYLEEVYF